MNCLKIICYALLLLLASGGLFSFIAGFTTLKKGRKIIAAYAPEKKFAVLIAARNEEKVIANLIESLKRQDYPECLYDIYAIPNNCADDTKGVAQKAGALILEVTPPIQTKGDVLKQAFMLLQDSCYDGYVIFDADNVVSPNFLQRMNDALCAGYPAAQGRRKSKNPKDSWVSGCNTVYLGMGHLFTDRVRMGMARCANIYGTGYMVSAELLTETGYPIKTLTEDLEYTALCILKDRQIAFVEDAVCFDEQAIKLANSVKQRKRWSAGSCECFNLYHSELASAYFKNKNKSALDMLLFLFAPYLQVGLTGLVLVIAVLLIFQSVISVGMASVYILIGVAGLYLLMVIFACVVVAMQRWKFKDNISGILSFPLLFISWLPINVACFFKTDIGWEPIEHDRAISIRQIYADQSSSKSGTVPRFISAKRQASDIKKRSLAGPLP